MSTTSDVDSELNDNSGNDDDGIAVLQNGQMLIFIAEDILQNIFTNDNTN